MNLLKRRPSSIESDPKEQARLKLLRLPKTRAAILIIAVLVIVVAAVASNIYYISKGPYLDREIDNWIDNIKSFVGEVYDYVVLLVMVMAVWAVLMHQTYITMIRGRPEWYFCKRKVKQNDTWDVLHFLNSKIIKVPFAQVQQPFVLLPNIIAAQNLYEDPKDGLQTLDTADYFYFKQSFAELEAEMMSDLYVAMKTMNVKGGEVIRPVEEPRSREETDEDDKSKVQT